MYSKVLVALCLVVVVASAVPAQPGGAWGGWGGPAGGAAGGVNPWLPPWLAGAPWLAQWSPCVGVGSSCLDCNTKLICTKIGGLQRACTDPTLPYCNLGQCSATPTAECAPATEAIVPL
ncbi:uncharacterized protein LOC113516130 [Galleria mellonella]|uniref:Uncharacterized protein LOC113516130 n=1 Tax=Galleria mellonella TaxID=7137 RepID=A0A6J1WMT2_GALME|nr:uncharacterized protein LOC113516130 [Galleria mellonella]